MRRFWLILTAFLGLALQAVPASAAVQYTLNCSAVASCAGNFGTVTLTDVGSGKINVAVALASGFTFGPKDGHLFLWNGTGNTDQLSISNITSNASSFSIEGSGNNGTYNPPPAPSPFSGTGAFDYSMTRGNNASGASTLSFDLTKSGGLALANFATTNDGGAYYFGALIRGSTGDPFFVVANQAGVNVPEPSTLTLSIAGLAGLAGLVLLQRRRYRAQAN